MSSTTTDPTSLADTVVDFEQTHAILVDRIGSGSRSIDIEHDRIALEPPGAGLSDLAGLLESLGAPPGLVPDDLPVRGIRIRQLTLERDSVDGGVWLQMWLEWAQANPVASMPQLTAAVATLELERRHERWLTTAAAGVTVHGYTLDGSLELPAGVLTARLRRSDTDLPTFDHSALRSARVEEVSVVAVLPLKHAVLHVAVTDAVTVGPVAVRRVEADFTLDGSDISRSAASVVGIADIDLGSGRTVEVTLRGSVSEHGWTLSGVAVPDPALGIGDLVNAVGGDARTLPDELVELEIARLALDIDSAAGTVRVECGLTWHDRPDARATIVVDHGPAGVELSGGLQLGALDFELRFGHSGVVIATFHAGGSHPLGIDDLLTAVGVEADTGLDVEVRAVLLALAGDDLVLAADIDGGIDLSALGKLPLVGHLLPGADSVRLALRPLVVRGSWEDATTLAAVADAAPDPIRIPTSVEPGIRLDADLHLGGDPIELDLDIASNDGAIGSADPQQTSATPLPAPAATTATATTVTWVDVQRAFGPVTIARAGYALGGTRDARVVELRLDGSLSVAGVTLDARRARRHLQVHTPAGDASPQRTRRRHRSCSRSHRRHVRERAGGLRRPRRASDTPEFTLSALGAFTTVDRSAVAVRVRTARLPARRTGVLLRRRPRRRFRVQPSVAAPRRRPRRHVPTRRRRDRAGKGPGAGHHRAQRSAGAHRRLRHPRARRALPRGRCEVHVVRDRRRLRARRAVDGCRGRGRRARRRDHPEPAGRARWRAADAARAVERTRPGST